MQRSRLPRRVRYCLAAIAALGGACAEPEPITPIVHPDATIDDATPDPIDAGFVTADADPIALDSSTSTRTDAGVSAPDAAPIADAGPQGIGPTCFADIWDPSANGPNYDQFGTAMGSHCFGTDHQTIAGIERVVFIGDSVTVGTPPTPSDEYYRARLADLLVARFNLDPPSDSWKRPNLISGTSLVRSSGDFWSCAKWGARTDDLLEDATQLEDCFPAEERNKRTLVIMTMGGNDIAAITKAGAPSGGASYAEVEQMTQQFVQKLRDSIDWLKDPARFPSGNDIIFSNMFEFTDATGDVSSCPAAGAAGFDEPWANPEDLEHLVIWANEQYARIAVETQTDMILMLEHFCGHGYHFDDPNGRCYRGPAAERWFDLSCIHPNPTGHDVIARMFMSVVDE